VLCVQRTLMAEQPFLRPPTQDYIEKHLRSCTAPAAAKPKHFGTAMRLFEHQANAPEPSDLADYTNRDGVELLMDSAEIKQAAAVADRRRLTLLLLCASQAAAGVGGCFVANGWLISAEVRMMQVTLVLIAFSGVMGFLGAWLRWGDALQGFFITQIWCLSTVFSQFMSRQHSNMKRDIYCGVDGRDESPQCAMMGQTIGVLGLGVIIVYVSMFFADGLAEYLQDKLEDEDNKQIVKFIWMMSKKTLIGVHRFEELIHAEFEKLVGMGFLKLKESS